MKSLQEHINNKSQTRFHRLPPEEAAIQNQILDAQFDKLRQEQEQRASCEVCGGAGWLANYDVAVDDPQFGRPVSCKACDYARDLRANAQAQRVERSGLPQEYRKLTFETFDALPSEQQRGKEYAREICEFYVNTPGHTFSLYEFHEVYEYRRTDDVRAKNSLVLYGEMGTCKTGLTAAVFHAVLEQGKAPLYIRVSDMLDRLTFDENQSAEKGGKKGIVQDFKKADLLMLDDANLSRSITGFKQQMMEDILRHRYANRLPTLITTNYTVNEFLDTWGNRCEVVIPMAHWVPCGGLDLRLL